MERKIIVNGEVKEFDNIVENIAENLPLNGVVSYPMLAVQKLLEPSTWDELDAVEAAFDLVETFRAFDILEDRRIMKVPNALGLFAVAEYFPYGKERQLRAARYWLYINFLIYLRNDDTETLTRLAVAAYTLPPQVGTYNVKEIKQTIHNAIRAYKTGKPVV